MRWRVVIQNGCTVLVCLYWLWVLCEKATKLRQDSVDFLEKVRLAQKLEKARNDPSFSRKFNKAGMDEICDYSSSMEPLYFETDYYRVDLSLITPVRNIHILIYSLCSC